MRSRTADPLTRFWEKVNKHGGYPDFTDPLVRITEADGECWLWTDRLTRDGYGAFFMRGRTFSAHRAAYTLLVDEIPSGFDIDHLCRRRNCVRHLEPVTERGNTLRGDGPCGRNARKDKCKNGHPFDAENTYRHGTDSRWRKCRVCVREAGRRYRLRLAGVAA